MVAAFTPQVAPGQAAQLGVDRVDQAAARRLFAVAPRDEQARHIRSLGHGPPFGTPLYTSP